MHTDRLIGRIMVILLQSAGGQEIKVSVGRMMCQVGFINSEIEDSCLCHHGSFWRKKSLFTAGDGHVNQQSDKLSGCLLLIPTANVCKYSRQWSGFKTLLKACAGSPARATPHVLCSQETTGHCSSIPSPIYHHFHPLNLICIDSVELPFTGLSGRFYTHHKHSITVKHVLARSVTNIH